VDKIGFVWVCFGFVLVIGNWLLVIGKSLLYKDLRSFGRFRNWVCFAYFSHRGHGFFVNRGLRGFTQILVTELTENTEIEPAKRLRPKLFTDASIDISFVLSRQAVWYCLLVPSLPALFI